LSGQALASAGMPDLVLPLVDTYSLARRAFPGRKSYAPAGACLRPSDFTADNAHRALGDAWTCMQLFKICVDELAFMGDLRLEDILD